MYAYSNFLCRIAVLKSIVKYLLCGVALSGAERTAQRDGEETELLSHRERREWRRR